MILLGIDGGKHSPGLAWFKDAEFLRLGTPKVVWLDQVVYERPVYYPTDPPGKVPALITLSIATGRLIERYAGVETKLEEVEARTWKGNVPKSVTRARVLKRLSKLEKARLKIDIASTPAKSHNDAFDAIGLCLWWLEKEGLR